MLAVGAISLLVLCVALKRIFDPDNEAFSLKPYYDGWRPVAWDECVWEPDNLKVYHE